MRRLNVLFLFITLISLYACTSAHDDAIRYGLSRMPVTLDPRFATDAASSRINRLIYRRLTDFNNAYKAIPSLANWQQLSATHYRFTLDAERRMFSNGQRLTSADVKATYEFILDKANASPHRISLKNINEMVLVDDNTLDFMIDEADPLFPGRLIIGIVPAKLIENKHAFNRHPIGSGAFTLKDWQGDTVLVLERNRDKQIIEFVETKDPTVRVLKLMRGEIDMIQNDLPPELVSYLEASDDINVVKTAGTNFAYLGFNMQDDTAGQAVVRKAIAHAIDRKDIIRYAMGDAARRANAILPPTHWAGNASLQAYEYNPQLSRELLKNIGVDRQHPLSLVYKTSSDPFRLRLATIIQQQLAEVGIKVEIRSYDWGTFYGDIKAGRFQMYSLMWVGVKLPDIFRYVFHSSAVPPEGANRGRLIDKNVDHLIEAAEAAKSIAEQAIHYQELQSLLHEKLAYVPLWYEDHVFISRRDIKGYTIASDGNYDGLNTVIRAK